VDMKGNVARDRISRKATTAASDKFFRTDCDSWNAVPTRPRLQQPATFYRQLGIGL